MGLESEYVVVSDAGRQWTVDHRYAMPHIYGYHVPSTLASRRDFPAWPRAWYGARSSCNAVQLVLQQEIRSDVR
jgi:hypothetical protein